MKERAMTARKKADLGRSSTQAGNELTREASSPSTLHTREPENNPRTFREANEQYAALRDRLRTTPRCPVCGASIELPCDTQLVRCDECGRKALSDVYREWGALIDRVVGATYTLGSWSKGELTIRSGGRTAARIEVAADEATIAPSETRLANILSSFDLAVREGEVAA
jgi:DNA-directed RNA polymerase subunit RPC12/RpoP